MSNSNTSNYKNSFDAIVTGIMKDTVQSVGRQASLTLAMYSNVAVYTSSNIVDVAKRKSTDRTETVDRYLSQASDTYRNTLDRIAVITDKSKSRNASEDEKWEVEALRKQVRATRAMFERALAGCFFLRVHNAEDIRQKRVGMSVYVLSTHPAGQKARAERTLTIASMANEGSKMLNDAAGKKSKNDSKSEGKTPNPTGNALADGSKALAATLSVLTKDDNTLKFSSFDKPIQQDLMSIFRQVLFAKFDKGGKLDVTALEAFYAGRDDRPVTDGNIKPDAAAKVA